jgi:hypothetical protein
MADLSPLPEVERTWDLGAIRSAFDPHRTLATPKLFHLSSPDFFQVSSLDSYTGVF